MGGTKDSQIIKLASPENQGLPYIESLEISLDTGTSHTKVFHWGIGEGEEDDYEVQRPNRDGVRRQVDVAARLLLQNLVPNTLKRCMLWEPIPLQIWTTLLKSQQHLTEVTIERADNLWMPMIEQNSMILSFMKDVEKLRLYPDCFDSLEMCSQILETCASVKELRIGNRMARTMLPDLMDLSTQLDLFSRTLFGHLMPFGSRPPLNLKFLTLEGFSVRHASDTLFKCIRLSSLRSLDVCYCDGADILFTALGKVDQALSDLKRLSWLAVQARRHEITIFESFLGLPKGLEHLLIDIRDSGCRLDVLPIIKHGRTLETLYISPHEGRALTVDELDEICTNCPRLRQLSVTFPERYMWDLRLTWDWERFLVC